MLKTARIGLICAIGVVALSSGVAIAKDWVHNTSFGPFKEITQEEIQDLKNSVGTIYNKFGEFVRVESPKSFRPFEIAYNDDAVNSNTKQIVLDYGVFEKVNKK